MDDIKVVTYNVHSCIGSDSHYSVERIAQTLQSQNPTVVCLQEVEANSVMERTRLWSVPHESHQPNEIAARLDMDYVSFIPAVRSRVLPTSSFVPKEEHDGLLGGEFGNAILSKYPIIQTEQLAYRRFKRKTLRNAIACLIQLPTSVKVWIVTTHLGVHATGAEQSEQAKELTGFLESLQDHPDNASIAGTILCGDFNSLPWFQSIRVVKSTGMKDVWDMNKGRGCTFPAKGLPLPLFGWIPPIFRLDFVFFKTKSTASEDDDSINGFADWIVLQCTFVVEGDSNGADILASDHLALCSIFEIRKRG